MKRAIEEFLDDQEDYLIALTRMERLEKGIDKPVPFEEIVKKHMRKHSSENLEH